MLYLIGLGLSEKGISLEGLETIKNCNDVYLEGYTVDFPYSLENLKKALDTDIKILNRGEVESDKIVNEAKEKDVALLVYGSPLVATTHITLVKDAIDLGVKYKIINSASIFDAIAESGLQLYKFGKITSMPQWDEEKSYKPDSFIEIILENKKINSHSLILCDIGLKFSKAIDQLKKASESKGVEIKEKLVACEAIGTKDQRFFYGTLEELRKSNNKIEIKNPFCLIIPGKLHHTEEDFLNYFKIQEEL